MKKSMKLNKLEQEINIPFDGLRLGAILGKPSRPKSLIIFAHGSGSGRWSSRNNYVARVLQKHGHATLLMDLLTEEESVNRRNIFDIQLLANRLNLAKSWARQNGFADVQCGLFGASTGAAAALVAAANDPSGIFAVVSRGGRPDLAKPVLHSVKPPSLLIVGSRDYGVIELNKEAYRHLQSNKALKLVPEATHLFEEPGALETVAELAAKWFDQYAPELIGEDRPTPS